MALENISTLDLEGLTNMDMTRESLPVGYQVDPWAQGEQCEGFNLESWLDLIDFTMVESWGRAPEWINPSPTGGHN